MSVTKEQIDEASWGDGMTKQQINEAIDRARAELPVQWMGDVIVALADQRAELVALLQRVNLLGPSEQWVADRDALLSRIGVTP